MSSRPPCIVPYTMPDGTVVQWDMANQPKPDTVGNNQSRIGFVYHPEAHPLGRFFQETVKKGLTSTIIKLHDWAIPKYGGKDAYVFEDARLKNLSEIMAKGRELHIDDNDAVRKRELVKAAEEIPLFLAKEDIFYRMLLFSFIQDIVKDAIQHPELYSLTEVEGYMHDKFSGMGPNVSTRDPRLQEFTFEKWKELKSKGLPAKPDLSAGGTKEYLKK